MDLRVEIKETNLEFSNLTERLATKRIVIHHSASPDVSASIIHSWHLSRGWAGIGYHYVIRVNGDIERGRPEWARGAHAPPANSDSIGICVAGNFEIDIPSADQIDALVRLLKDIRARYEKNLPVIGHKDVMSTLCPGSRFLWAELYSKLKGEDEVAVTWKLQIINDAKNAGLITSDHDPDDTATKWFVLAVALNILKVLKGA